MNKLLIPALICAAFTSGSRLAAQSAGDEVRTQAARQKQVAVDSRQLVDQLDAMIDEYQRNGLAGDEIKNLQSLRAILGKVSDKDMSKIVALLEQAGAQNDPKAALQAIANAYTQQKGVLSQLKQVLASYENSQEALDLSNRMKELADRQAANLQTAIETAQWTLSGKADTKAAVEASMQGQAAEQKSIRDDLNLLNKKIDAFAKDPANQALAQRFKQGLDFGTKVASLVGQASDSLDQKKLIDAAMTEKSARDAMRQLARTIAPPRDPAEILQEAAERLDKLINQQQDVIAATKESGGMSIIDYVAFELQKEHNHIFNEVKRQGRFNLPVEQLAQQPSIIHEFDYYKRSGSNESPAIENREGDLVSQTDVLSQDIQEAAKPAADALIASMFPMMDARAALSGRDPTHALASEGTVLVDLQKAKEALERQLAEAQKLESGDKAAALQELQRQARQILAQQAALRQQSAAPSTPQQAAAMAQKENALQQQAAQVEQAASASAPAAAQSLANAANNMQQAAAAMTNSGQTPQAQSQQAQAMQNLANASQQIGQQINQLQQDKQQAVADQKDLEELEKIIEAEQKLHADTLQSAAGEAKQAAGPVQALAPGQQQIQQQTTVYGKTLAAGAGGGPADNAASAAGHMATAGGDLQSGNGRAADPEERKALDDLYAIKNALEAQLQNAQQALGANAAAQQAEASQADADAAQAVAQAQAQLAQANAEMNQGQPNADQQAAGQMAQAANQVGDAAAKAGDLPAGAQQAMRDAAAAMAQAAAQAGAGQSAQAQANGQQAAQALAQAGAALAQAQAGIASGPPQPGEGQQGTTPGPMTAEAMPAPPGKGSSGQGSTGGGGTNAATGKTPLSKAQFIGLPQRDRAAIQQAENEKYPQQYATKVEQYLQNLADENNSH